MVFSLPSPLPLKSWFAESPYYLFNNPSLPSTSKVKLTTFQRPLSRKYGSNSRAYFSTVSGPDHTMHFTRIWKQFFQPEYASNVFRPNYTGGFCNCNNRWPFCIHVWVKLGQLNISDYREVIVLRKSSFSLYFPSTQIHKVGIFKLLRFRGRFRKVPFSWWISVDRSHRLTVEIKIF